MMPMPHALLQSDIEPDRSPVPVARALMPAAADILPYLEAIDRSGWYSNFGPLSQALEIRLARRLQGEAQAVTVSNGTTGLCLALRALALPEGAWCILPSWTFVATAHAVIESGLKPFFVDVDPVTGMLDPEACGRYLGKVPGTVAAIVPVCAYGAPIDMEAWSRFQAHTGVKVVIDAAAAHDTITSAPVPVVVSLHATKVLGAGEGGYVVSNDADFCQRLRTLSSFGFCGSREALMPATNAKMSEYAAAVAMAGMDNWATTRFLYQNTALRMRAALQDLPQVEFQTGWGEQWITSVCVVRLPEVRARAAAQYLAANGMDTRLWWGHGCHRSAAFGHIARMNLPHTEHLAEVSLGLPYSAHMDEADILRLADLLRSFFAYD